MLLARVIALLPVVTAVVPWAITARRNRTAWARALPGVVQGSPYREATVVPGHAYGVPPLVRWASLSCYVLGQMAVPGAAVAAFGLLYLGAGLLGIPGLVVAVRLWLLGPRLLRRAPGVVASAMRTTRWAIVLNVVVLVLAGLILALVRREDELVFPLFLVVYAIVSLAQAGLVRHALRTYAPQFGAADAAASGSGDRGVALPLAS